MASLELFNKDGCKLILGFGYYVLPSVSTAVNPVILFTFNTNFRQALHMPNLCVCSFTKCFSSCKTTGISPLQVENLRFSKRRHVERDGKIDWYSNVKGDKVCPLHISKNVQII